ncbi:DNA-binding protein [Bacteroidia bacterium]|nr:DNA-binding protein [Bacteroidia bacterium]
MENQLVHIQNLIYEIRGQKVMLDFDLAVMYQVENKNLKRAVRRNIERFPPDFMFELTENEWEILRCQNGTLKSEGRGQHPKYLPFAFTEQGIAQLSSVLNSPFAIKVNITIIRAFVVLRQYALGYAELNAKLETFMHETNMQFNEVYQALTELAEQKRLRDKPRRKIGFFTDEQIKKGEDIIE